MVGRDFTRWAVSGVSENLFKALADDPDNEYAMIDATIVRAHQYSAGALKKGFWFGDDLDPVVECHTENEFWQLVVTLETTPGFLGALKQFEDHRERRPVGQASL